MRCWWCFPKTTRARVRGVNGVEAWGVKNRFQKIKNGGGDGAQSRAGDHADGAAANGAVVKTF